MITVPKGVLTNQDGTELSKTGLTIDHVPLILFVALYFSLTGLALGLIRTKAKYSARGWLLGCVCGPFVLLSSDPVWRNFAAPVVVALGGSILFIIFGIVIDINGGKFNTYVSGKKMARRKDKETSPPKLDETERKRLAAEAEERRIARAKHRRLVLAANQRMAHENRRKRLGAEADRIRLGATKVRIPKDADDFEEVCAEWMRKTGYPNAKRTPKGPDGGIDVIAKDAVAQAKMYSNKKVTAEEVRALIGSKVQMKKNKALFFTYGPGYTEESVKLAEQTKVLLYQLDVDRRTFRQV